jgi:CRISPR-associated endonuclease Csn1
MLIRLWEELDATGRKCPFTGKHLSQEMLWSGELEIEHILPFSRTLDDGFNNKVLAVREANRRKSRLSPWEAVEAGIFDRETIEGSLRDLPSAKAWRFGPDAMEQFENEERDFLDRQLNDNKYISRLAAQYLKSLGSDVWVINGRLTADLRHHWGLNSVLAGHNRKPADSEADEVRKNRNDHRHHPVDAFVIACTDRAMVKAAADEARKVEQEFADGKRDHRRLLAGLPDPFDGYLLAVKEAVGRIVVSHKPDHGIAGKLHEATNYGVVQTQAGETRLATRKAITELTPGEVASIGDDRIRRELVALTDGLGDKERKQALLEYSQRTGHKRVRVHKVQASFERIVHGPDSKGKSHTRAVIPGDNYCMDIVETPDGKWHGVAVTRFQAHKFKKNDAWKTIWRKDYPDGRLTMRVRNGDLLMLEHEGEEKVMQVVRLNPSGNRLYLAPAYEAGKFADRHKDADDEFRWDLAGISGLKPRKARLMRVTPDGQLLDPGPPA